MLESHEPLDRDGPGDAAASLYDTLRAIAHERMKSERAGHTLDATAVVHEAYVRLSDVETAIWSDREHFLSVAASTIRRVLVDHARGRDRQKRGGGNGPVSLHSGIAGELDEAIDVLALDDALTRLAARDAQAAQLVEMRFFGGVPIERAAELIGIGRNTASRRWRVARAWLKRELAGVAAEEEQGQEQGREHAG